MPRETTLTLPTLHMNGTGFKMLSEGYEQAADKLDDFTDAFGSIEFNARDYYVQNPEAYPKAREERMAIHAHIKAIKDYLHTHRIAIHDQRKA